MLYLLAMMTSCHFVSKQNLGDNDLRFLLKLEGADGCFCLNGHACADLVRDGFTVTCSKVFLCNVGLHYQAISPPELALSFQHTATIERS
jgi:hypothetical protein